MSYVRNLWGNFTRIFTPSFVERQSESPRESEVTLLCENDEENETLPSYMNGQSLVQDSSYSKRICSRPQSNESAILSDSNQENDSFCHRTVLTRPKSSSDDEILDLSHKIVETPKSTKCRNDPSLSHSDSVLPHRDTPYPRPKSEQHTFSGSAHDDSAYHTQCALNFSENPSMERGQKHNFSENTHLSTREDSPRWLKTAIDFEQNRDVFPKRGACQPHQQAGTSINNTGHVTFGDTGLSQRNAEVNRDVGDRREIESAKLDRNSSTEYFCESRDRRDRTFDKLPRGIFTDKRPNEPPRAPEAKFINLDHDYRHAPGTGDMRQLKVDATDRECSPSYEQSDRQKRKFKEPDVYNGENVEWPDYLCHFEQVAFWNQWSDSEKAIQLAMSLRGTAQRILSELTQRELCSFNILKHALTQRFCPTERETAHRCDFRNRRRRPGESAADYGYALKRLASRAFPSFMPEMRESLVVEQYVSGLGSQELKRYVQFSHPNSLDRAISLAIEFEAFEGVQDGIRKPRDTESSAVRALIPPKTANSENIDITELATSVGEIQKTLKSLLHENRFQPKDRKRGKIQCYNCKEEGHISRNCPQKQSSNSEQTQTVAGNHGNGTDTLNVNGLGSRPQVQPKQTM